MMKMMMLMTMIMLFPKLPHATSSQMRGGNTVLVSTNILVLDPLSSVA